MTFERATTRTVIAALVFLFLGTLALVTGANVEMKWLSSLLTSVGSFVIASVVMTLIFEFWQLRGLVEDLFRHAGVAEQISRAQIGGFSVSLSDNVPWEELFLESNRLDLMVAYGATWRNTHHRRLERFIARAEAELQVVLPDPDSDVTMNELARRFEMPVQELRGRINEAAQFFRQLANGAPGWVRIHFLPRAPHFTFYKFSNRAVFASYRHSPGRGAILTLVAKGGGELYEWIRGEWYGIVGSKPGAGLTRLVFDSRAPEPAKADSDSPREPTPASGPAHGGTVAARS
jgi:hypothetical protein